MTLTFVELIDESAEPTREEVSVPHFRRRRGSCFFGRSDVANCKNFQCGKVFIKTSTDACNRRDFCSIVRTSKETCEAHKCGAGLLHKLQDATVGCNDDSCSDEECCEKKAACDEYQCPAGCLRTSMKPCGKTKCEESHCLAMWQRLPQNFQSSL